MLSWNEIRVRAAQFAAEWADASYEKGETHSFYDAFFDVFGKRRRDVARYEEHVKKLDNTHGFIDLFWPSVLLVEQKSAGRSLIAAAEQAGTYFDAIPERERPRYQLLCDFKTFELLDRDTREEIRFSLADLPDQVENFAFIVGQRRRALREEDPVNIEASELMGRLHDALDESGYRGDDLERFLVRMVFCMFADDSGIFPRQDMFLHLVEERTSVDGADLGMWLTRLFEELDRPIERRQRKLDEDLAKFPYVNGELFAERLSIPDFDSEMRSALLDACRFNWSKTSPAIFGALFQSVMEPIERRSQGAHYTTEQNILRVIEPLFLDDLRAEFDALAAKHSGDVVAELYRLRDRLGELRFFDPACGCGNFLIIAYRELRLLEIDVLDEIAARTRLSAQQVMPFEVKSVIDVDQFYGIEISEFPARIAATSLWMMDHLMNRELADTFGEPYVRIPLEKSPHIEVGDALELDWTTFLPPAECSYVFGNPPFIGAKFQSTEQRAQVRRIADLGGSGGTLDYVTAWFIRAAEYVRQTDTAAGLGPRSPRIGFVATNSITQGEQVAQFWPIIFDRHDLEISYAHRTFAWGSDARGKAHVHVIILGLDPAEHAPADRPLYTYTDINSEPLVGTCKAITPYLLDGTRLKDPYRVVKSASGPINGMPRLRIGSKPIDNGHYIFDSEEMALFLGQEPAAEKYLRPYVGAREYLQGGDRWILALHEASPTELSRMPLVRKRIAAVRDYRRSSASKPTQRLAETPKLWHVNVIPREPYLVLPEVSSERREYLPIGWLEPPIIPSNLVKVLIDASLAEFGLLSSAMHMAWMRAVAGRMKSDYRYSVGVVYNTFPLPRGFSDDGPSAKLDAPAQAVLDARAAHPGATLAELYDPDLMPTDLRKAHRELDRAVDRLYRSRPVFKSESERLQHLFGLYERVSGTLPT
ncbi:class I SAM-dependent DNA methyltransferase [Candidatus Poriferisodalis sp.]|uniref:class I SAM-dependent DNA methyltransferase n=1 Tax=Candidatus Poriferisodalis sp. TaxID=3101277 RepID=UPI003AF84B46